MAFLERAFLFLTISLIRNHVSCSVDGYDSVIKCEFYDEKVCMDPENNCSSTISDDLEEDNAEGEKINECEPGKENYCFALWSNDSHGRITVKKKGCFSENTNCDSKSKCIGHRKIGNLIYCCCDEDLCNTEFYLEPASLEVEEPSEYESASESVSFVTLILVILTCSAIFSLSFYYIRKRKLCYFKENQRFDERSQTDSSPSLEKLLPIELLTVKAQGRFGEVWKAMYKAKNELVAVKMVPPQFKQSWTTELEVFNALQSGHENILQFYGAEKHYDGPQLKYWLITAYHERGSLYEHLKNNTVTYEQACSISYTMARGLDYLHDEIIAKLPECSKPPMAHRDFKSNNVLLKDDFNACIADFGLAIIFKNSNFDDSNHGQVGTTRYMAPEVLEGSINFSTSSFQRIDMYACGLVLWEILSRCTAHEDATAKYKLPFEQELGEHPTVNQMYELVVNQKKRPEIKESWVNHPLLSGICETIEECWDAESEARITASCVAERFHSHLRSTIKCETETKLLHNIV
ncbi:activin receptor type-2B-like [Planococcus citri]|uniref:activin receptor type-2B-like n=1 Tax=Planococcus citri TaxID=170843 RepID=UPI0031F93031